MKMTKVFKPAVVIVLTIVVVLNLYILYTSGNAHDIAESSINFQTCEKLVDVRFHQKPLTADEIQSQWMNQKGPGRRLFAPRPNIDKVVIGIPLLPSSVTISELHQCLQSLVKQSTKWQQTENTVILFLLGTDLGYNQQLVFNVTHSFTYHVNIGFLRIVEVPSFHKDQFFKDNNHANSSTLGKTSIPTNFSRELYLSLEQAAGFSFMYSYVYNNNISQYFLQLKGREICFDDYFNHIELYAESHGDSWSMLDFTKRHFVGTFFKTSDLSSLNRMMVLFWEQVPSRYLLALFCISKLQSTQKLREPPLFLDIDRNVEYQQEGEAYLYEIIRNAGQLISTNTGLPDNPDALVTTNMIHDGKLDLSTAYKSGLYFDMHLPKNKDWLVIMFQKPQKLHKVIIETGNILKPSSFLHYARLEASAACDYYNEIGKFSGGQVEATHLDEMEDLNFVKCLQIVVTENHTQSVTFSKIAIFLYKEMNTFHNIPHLHS